MEGDVVPGVGGRARLEVDAEPLAAGARPARDGEDEAGRDAVEWAHVGDGLGIDLIVVMVTRKMNRFRIDIDCLR